MNSALNIQRKHQIMPASRTGILWTHLTQAQKTHTTLPFKALNPENSPLSQLMVKLTNQAPINTDSKQHNQSKDLYLEHWRNETKTQSRINCYLTLHREYQMAAYWSNTGCGIYMWSLLDRRGRDLGALPPPLWEVLFSKRPPLQGNSQVNTKLLNVNSRGEIGSTHG